MSTATLVAESPVLASQQSLISQFNRDGFLHLPGVLNAEECSALKDRIDRAFADPKVVASTNYYGEFILTRLFELDPLFQKMLTREPIISLIEKVLGPDCHLIAQNVVRNKPGQAIDQWHADDIVMLP